jgi:hypothetical protein
MTPSLSEVLALLAKATPGEWAQAHRKVHNGYSTEVFDEAGEAIATLAWHAKPPRFEGSQKIISTDRPENAEAIVVAVNYLRSHGAAIQVLARFAEGRIQHRNWGDCPDEIEGHDSRDPKCEVCAALSNIEGGQS